MKKLLTIVLLFISISVNAIGLGSSTLTSLQPTGKIYYVATNGNDNNSGSITAPFASWEKLSSVLKAGDQAFIRGGTYRSNKSAETDVQVRWQNLQGTFTDSIKIYAYPGEKPVLDLSDVLHTNNPYGLYLQNSNYVHIKGLRITGLAQHTKGNVVYGWINDRSTNIKIELCEVDRIGGQGYFDYYSSNILYKNCDVHHCDDRYSSYAWNGSNGFSATGGGNTATNITYDGCRAWWISDDGWDFYAINGLITIKNCWGFWNGYQPGTFIPAGDGSGAKMGPTDGAFPNTVLRILTNNLFFENREKGIDQNGGICLFVILNNTTYKNGNTGIVFSYTPTYKHDSRNNISYRDPTPIQGGEIIGSNNSWNGSLSIFDTNFGGTSSAGADGPRQTDGSLPALKFLRLANSLLAGMGAYPDYTVEKIVAWRMHIYSDGTASTAKTINAKKILIGDIVYYKDGSREFKQ